MLELTVLFQNKHCCHKLHFILKDVTSLKLYQAAKIFARNLGPPSPGNAKDLRIKLPYHRQIANVSTRNVIHLNAPIVATSSKLLAS